jgi:hypothetical protein
MKPRLTDLEFEPSKAFERLKQFARVILAVPKKDVIKFKKFALHKGGVEPVFNNAALFATEGSVATLKR